MTNKDMRELILARRSRWVAATIACAGIAAGASQEGCCPRACLDVAPADANDLPPHPCLSPPPPPQPCLSVPMLKDAGGSPTPPITPKKKTNP